MSLRILQVSHVAAGIYLFDEHQIISVYNVLRKSIKRQIEKTIDLAIHSIDNFVKDNKQQKEKTFRLLFCLTK